MSKIDQAFGDDLQLVQRIKDVVDQKANPQIFGLIDDISAYVLKLRGSSTTESLNSKKRKIDTLQNGAAYESKASKPQKLTFPYACDNVSVAVPMRKKLKLQFCVDNADITRSSIELLNPATNASEYRLQSAHIEAAFCLPVPDKQARQWNFVIIPQSTAQDSPDSPAEQLVFTLNEPKNSDGTSPDDIALTETHLNNLLRPFHKQTTRTSETEFHSAIPQPHRKNEKAYHVSAHRGSKEGYLFFLPNGILFGFKKPLAFFPFAAIESISYTSVLQRTFNLVITASELQGETTNSAPSDVKEIEFSMLDQADFAGIDAYVKKHGLNDASMAADRRAKAYNINKDTKKVLDENGEVKEDGVETSQPNGDAEMTEQQLQDEEDELEEDYEASGGESDGEGDYSEEDEDGGEGEGDGYEEGYEEGDEGEEYDEVDSKE